MGDKVAAHKGAVLKQIVLEIYTHRNWCGDEIQECIMVGMVGWIYTIFLQMAKYSQRAINRQLKSLDFCKFTQIQETSISQ